MARHYGVIGGNAPPAAVSVTPSSGIGASQTLTMLFSDANGYTDIPVMLVVANEVLSAAGSCYMYVDRTSGFIYLMNDAATAWAGPLRLGSAGTMANSQCVVNAGASSLVGGGTNLTLRLALTFLRRGTKGIYMYAQDAAGLNTGWQQRGTWTVP
jgi:hypothetical protein